MWNILAENIPCNIIFDTSICRIYRNTPEDVRCQMSLSRFEPFKDDKPIMFGAQTVIEFQTSQAKQI